MIRVNKYVMTQETAAELDKMAQNARKRAKRIKQERLAPSREMQMVPKLLELAQYKGNYRFNSAEVTELSNLIKKYGSEIPATDLVKQLLDIGSEKGELLSVKEMKDFFLTTPLLDGKGQTRVISFMKTLKETAPPSLKEYYAHVAACKVNLNQYKAYASQFDMSSLGISKYINQKNLDFVYGIANCKKPEILAKIAQNSGAAPEISVVPNELVKAYELSKGHMSFVQDLIFGFYPYEIKQIVSKLTENKKPFDFSQYCPQISASAYRYYDTGFEDLPTSRREILKQLDLTEEIELLKLETYKRIKTVDGNFERGKRQ